MMYLLLSLLLLIEGSLTISKARHVNKNSSFYKLKNGNLCNVILKHYLKNIYFNITNGYRS